MFIIIIFLFFNQNITKKYVAEKRMIIIETKQSKTVRLVSAADSKFKIDRQIVPLGKALNLGFLWRRALVYFMLLWTKTSANYRHISEREISAHLMYGAESPARPARSGNVFKTPPHAEVSYIPKDHIQYVD